MCLLDLCRLRSVHLRARFREDLAGGGVDDILREDVADDTAAEMKLLIKLISSDLCKIVSSRVEEHGVEQPLRALHGERLARADLPVQLQKAVAVVVGLILRKACQELRLVAEHVKDLLVGAEAQGTEQDADRYLSGTVHADIEDVVGIRLILQPRAAVRDHLAEIALLAKLVVLYGIIDAGRTDQLADDDSLSTVDHEGTGIGHQGQIAHEDLMLLHIILIFIVKSDFDFHRSGIGCIPFLAFRDGIFHIIPVQMKVDKIQAEMSCEILDRENIVEHFAQAFAQKPFIGILLDLYEVRHLKNFLLFGEAHADAFAGFDRTHLAFFHVSNHPCFQT